MKKSFYLEKFKAQTFVVLKNNCGATLCLHMHPLIENLFQAMRRPTGFTMDNSYLALDVDVWCPDVVVVVVCVCGGGGGGCKSRHI